MKSSLLGIAFAMLVSAPLSTALGQIHHRDPLNPLESDQLRDAAMDGDIRLKLYVKFARTRLDTLEQTFSNAKAADRGQQTHDRLQDFLDIYDEFDQNVDSFADRKADLRKVLKLILEADTEFQSKLRAIRATADIKPAIRQQYEFLLTTALETVDNATQDHRQLLADQEEAFKHKKKTKSDDPDHRPE